MNYRLVIIALVMLLGSCMSHHASSKSQRHKQDNRLRHWCETKLKKRFSLSAFHDQVLKNGEVPLATLRMAIARWLSSQEKVGLK